MKTINFSKARENLSMVLDSVAADANYTVIKRRQKPDAVIMSLEYFSSLMETLYLLSTPANAQHLMRGIAQHQQGLVKEHDLLDA